MSALLRSTEGQPAPKSAKKGSGKGGGAANKRKQEQEPAAAAGSMDVDGAAAGAAASRARGFTSDSNVRGLALHVAQMGLSAMASVRALQAISIDTLLVDRAMAAGTGDDKINMIDKLKQVTKAHYEALQAMETEAQRAQLGPPHEHVWIELVQWVMMKFKVVDPSKKESGYSPGMDIKQLQAYTDEIKQMGPGKRTQVILQEVRHCRVAKTYNKQKAKVEAALAARVSATTLQTWQATRRLLQAVGAQHKLGQAPRGSSERQVSRILSTMGRNQAEDWAW
eukprot:TRINITY_DN70981_c0_g2_i1.p2 TRINITY_DN70981_c0_g2~~TRINITY_DN70981_c0_g2_i1.p2  ORF type:complete len:281 (-),score=76.70 TRINITY_DN70981_c0_g2_i1:470-1312(-)